MNLTHEYNTYEKQYKSLFNKFIDGVILVSDNIKGPLTCHKFIDGSVGEFKYNKMIKRRFPDGVIETYHHTTYSSCGIIGNIGGKIYRYRKYPDGSVDSFIYGIYGLYTRSHRVDDNIEVYDRFGELAYRTTRRSSSKKEWVKDEYTHYCDIDYNYLRSEHRFFNKVSGRLLYRELPDGTIEYYNDQDKIIYRKNPDETMEYWCYNKSNEYKIHNISPDITLFYINGIIVNITFTCEYVTNEIVIGNDVKLICNKLEDGSVELFDTNDNYVVYRLRSDGNRTFEHFKKYNGHVRIYSRENMFNTKLVYDEYGHVILKYTENVKEKYYIYGNIISSEPR